MIMIIFCHGFKADNNETNNLTDCDLCISTDFACFKFSSDKLWEVFLSLLQNREKRLKKKTVGKVRSTNFSSGSSVDWRPKV